MVIRGSRFSYTYYYPEAPNSNVPSAPIHLVKGSSKPSIEHPIHLSIEYLDKEAMQILSLPGTHDNAAEAHDAFSAYLVRTKNTICGRHPIGVLFGALKALEALSWFRCPDNAMAVQWVRYEQSSAVKDVGDSSVSYASAFVIF